MYRVHGAPQKSTSIGSLNFHVCVAKEADSRAMDFLQQFGLAPGTFRMFSDTVGRRTHDCVARWTGNQNRIRSGSSLGAHRSRFAGKLSWQGTWVRRQYFSTLLLHLVVPQSPAL